MINIVATIIFELLGKFQRYYTKNEQTLAIFGNILWLQFLNFAIVPLIVKLNVNFPPVNMFGLAKGPYHEFNQKWYNDVGAIMCYTMLLNTLTPHIGKIAVPLALKFLRFMDRGCKNGMQNQDGSVRTKKVL